MPLEKLTRLEPPEHSLNPREATATVRRWHSLLGRDSTATTLSTPHGKCPSATPEGLQGLLPHAVPHPSEPRL